VHVPPPCLFSTGILSAQLLLTAAIAAPVVLSSGVKQSLMAHPGVMALALVVSLGCLLTLSFSESARHSHPTNLILLGVFTAAEGLMVGAVCAQYKLLSVALAVMITACITGGLALYALTTKKDFTMQNGLLLTLLFTLIGAGLVNVFVRSSAMELALAAGGALLFGAYIVVDVQMLAGGKHTEQRISPDEYVLGAITIYLVGGAAAGAQGVVPPVLLVYHGCNTHRPDVAPSPCLYGCILHWE
jgi:FtsH-binding integral membrane protein